MNAVEPGPAVLGWGKEAVGDETVKVKMLFEGGDGAVDVADGAEARLGGCGGRGAADGGLYGAEKNAHPAAVVDVLEWAEVAWF
jgi:hypothetical protein